MKIIVTKPHPYDNRYKVGDIFIALESGGGVYWVADSKVTCISKKRAQPYRTNKYATK